MRLPPADSTNEAAIDMEALNRMVDTFLERGFSCFDTAYMYHSHKSEIALREALVKRHRRASFTVATKLPTMFLKSEEDQERIFIEQLEKCGVEYFDYYLLHNLNISNYETAEKFDSFRYSRVFLPVQHRKTVGTERLLHSKGLLQESYTKLREGLRLHRLREVRRKLPPAPAHHRPPGGCCRGLRA